MGMGFAPSWLRQVSPPPRLHKTTLTTVESIPIPPEVINVGLYIILSFSGN